MKREHQENSGPSSGGSEGTSLMAEASGKRKTKMWEETLEPETNDDELLAVLGYKVRSSEMAEVAHKIEQLETVMESTQEDALLSHLSSDTVHYNPSDLSTWLESMLSELNPPTNFESNSVQSSVITTVDFPNSTRQQQKTQIYSEPSSSDYDLRAIPFPGGTIYGEKERKRMKQHASASSSSNGVRVLAESTRPVVLIDSQETGIRLVHTLMACAEAVQQENLKLAEALVKQIRSLAVSLAGPMSKVAAYFAEALARRIYRFYLQPSLDFAFSDMLEMHFYEACPYLKFAHFTANQAILEAFSANSRVHVIDFSMKQGLQWPALMQALAVRPGGPPAFRLTGIGPPQPNNTDTLQQVGWKLAQFAETIHVEFEYKGFVANSLADLDASMLEIRSSEAVAVNSIFEMHRLLAQPGSIDKVMSSIKQMKPKIVTIVEQEANHNGPVFLDRFMESLHYYSTVFDSLEGSGVSQCNSEDLVMSEMYLGQQICNVVSCEGVKRVERHQTLTQWRTTLGSAGFVPVHLGSNAFKQASMLLALFASGDGYRVEENKGCLMLGWHTRPLIATSAWQLASVESQ